MSIAPDLTDAFAGLTGFVGLVSAIRESKELNTVNRNDLRAIQTMLESRVEQLKTLEMFYLRHEDCLGDHVKDILGRLLSGYATYYRPYNLDPR